MTRIALAVFLGGTIIGAAQAQPKPAAPPSAGSAEQIVPFDTEKPGEPPAQFESIIGDWNIGEVAGARGLWVDGTKWRQGTPSASLADQAKRLYGDRYAEFLDGVKAFAFFPLAVYRGDCGGKKANAFGSLLSAERAHRSSCGHRVEHRTGWQLLGRTRQRAGEQRPFLQGRARQANRRAKRAQCRHRHEEMAHAQGDAQRQVTER